MKRRRSIHVTVARLRNGKEMGPLMRCDAMRYNAGDMPTVAMLHADRTQHYSMWCMIMPLLSRQDREKSNQ